MRNMRFSWSLLHRIALLGALFALTLPAAAQRPVPASDAAPYRFTYNVTNPFTGEEVTVTDIYRIENDQSAREGCASSRPVVLNDGSVAVVRRAGVASVLRSVLNVPVYEKRNCTGAVQTLFFTLHTEFTGAAPAEQFHLAASYAVVCDYVHNTVQVRRLGWSTADSEDLETLTPEPLAGNAQPGDGARVDEAPAAYRPALDTGCGSTPSGERK